MTGFRLSLPAWLPTLVLVAAAAALVQAAGLVMFSAFMFYDDEGYVLLSLRNFAEHGKLYTEVYTQYGPFPFVFYSALDALGMPLTHTAGRLLTLGAWSGTALLCAWLTGCATRSFAVRLAVLAAVFVYLWVMASEPTHPGGLIALITAALAALGYRWILRERLRAWAILAGAGAAALLLTKINVGAFAALSTLAWWSLHHRHPTVRRLAPWGLAVAAVLLPLGLMRLLLSVPWVQTFALVFACGSIAAIAATARDPAPRTGGKELGWAAAGAGTVIVVVLGVIFFRGTTVRDLLDGVLLGPLRLPANFSLRFLWPPGIRGIAAGSFALCGLACLLRRRGVAGVDTAVAALRLVVAIGAAATVARFDSISPDNLVFAFTMPCLWIFLWPLAGENPGATTARVWLGFLLLGQCLHVFPVPGSQIAWSTLLALPLAGIGGWEAATWLAGRYPRAAGRDWRIPAITLQCAVAVFAIWAGSQLVKMGNRYWIGSNLALPGAEPVRLPTESTALFRLLTLNAIAHGDMLFSMPGMFSFNLWSGLPTPTLTNVTHWFSLLNADQQQAAIRSLEAHPRACVIVQREHLNFLRGRGLSPSGPLHDYIAENFTPAFTLDDFEFSVRRGRRIQPVMLARASSLSTAEKENTVLTLTLLLPPDKPIGRLEVASALNSPGNPLILDATNSRVEVTPTNARGEPAGPTEKATWPLLLKGPSTVAVYFGREGLPQPVRGGLVVLRDPGGAEIALARLER